MAADRASRTHRGHNGVSADEQVLFEGAPQPAVVKRMLYDKGFGFLKLEGGTEAFFHKSGLVNPGTFDGFAANDHVTAKIKSTSKGLRAFDVQGI